VETSDSHSNGAGNGSVVRLEGRGGVPSLPRSDRLQRL